MRLGGRDADLAHRHAHAGQAPLDVDLARGGERLAGAVRMRGTVRGPAGRGSRRWWRMGARSLSRYLPFLGGAEGETRETKGRTRKRGLDWCSSGRSSLPFAGITQIRSLRVVRRRTLSLAAPLALHRHACHAPAPLPSARSALSTGGLPMPQRAPRARSPSLAAALLAAILALAVPVSAAERPVPLVPKGWLTPAEAAGFRATPSYDETIAFLERLARRLPEMTPPFLRQLGRRAAVAARHRRQGPRLPSGWRGRGGGARARRDEAGERAGAQGTRRSASVDRSGRSSSSRTASTPARSTARTPA